MKGRPATNPANEAVRDRLRREPKRWLVTGVAGFIGSNLLEHLLKLNQPVVGIDNFSTGTPRNLAEVRSLVTEEQWSRFTFIEGDIRDAAVCKKLCDGVHFILHEAALCSVPRSIEDPVATHEHNVTGTLNLLVAARDAGVRRVVFAASSSTYGDDPGLPKGEHMTGRPLSPYALSKLVNELYAEVFARCYGLETIGLRYFNVFGPRQDPRGAYAAVIPSWIAAMIRNEAVYINGDGETSRDFCYVENVVQMNLLAALAAAPGAVNQVYNAAVGVRTDLNTLFELLRSRLERDFSHLKSYKPLYRDFRSGDVRHSQADIGKAERLLGYRPTHTTEQGLDASLEWYRMNVS